MTNHWQALRAVGARLRGDRRGAAAMFVAAGLVTALGSAAFNVDLGNAMVARRSLQASTDAAALAGGNANASASASASAKMVASITPGYPQLKCLASTGVSCTGPDSANAIVVRQQATVPMAFAKVFGISTLDIAAMPRRRLPT